MRRGLRLLVYPLVLPLLLCLCARTDCLAELKIDDPLQWSTKGIRSGGQFVSGGWKVTGKSDYILWHVPTIAKGAVEFDVSGLNPNECRAGMEDKSEIFHTYDYLWNNADNIYDPGYRNNPYKHFIRKIGCLGSYNGSIDAMEIVWSCNGDWFEADSPVLSWNPATSYHFRVEWGPDSAGNSVLKIYRDGQQVFSRSAAGSLGKQRRDRSSPSLRCSQSGQGRAGRTAGGIICKESDGRVR